MFHEVVPIFVIFLVGTFSYFRSQFINLLDTKYLHFVVNGLNILEDVCCAIAADAMIILQVSLSICCCQAEEYSYL